MYIINTIPHGKCFVRYLRTRFCIRNLTRSLRSLVRFLIRQQLVRKYRTPALSMKYSLYTTRYKNVFLWPFKPATFCCKEKDYPLLSATTIRNLQQPEQRSDSKARACPEARYKVYSGPSIYL